jgi:hypothetical protein
MRRPLARTAAARRAGRAQGRAIGLNPSCVDCGHAVVDGSDELVGRHGDDRKRADPLAARMNDNEHLLDEFELNGSVSAQRQHNS